MKVFFGIVCLSLMACNTVKQPLGGGQGVDGYVYLKSGNQMPGPGSTASKGKTISCQVLVYAPATLQQVTGTSPAFSKVNTSFVGTATSDSTGHYKLMLKPGKYSVFIKDGESLFANQSDRNGILNPVEVYPGKVTRKDLTLDKAVY